MIWAVRQQDGTVIAGNLRSAMGAYSRSTAEGAALDLGPAGAFSSGVDYAVFNAMVLSEPVTSVRLARVLDQGEEFYRERGLGWSCWLDETMVQSNGGPRAARVLEARGMRWIAEHEGMLTSRIRPDRGQLPEVPTRAVADQRTREDFVEVCSRVFLLPEEITRRIYGSASFWNGVMRGWVGYSEGRPVCIAVSAADQDSVGLYSVGTMPGFRRRGYGESITRHAIGEATGRSGLSRWSLQSTPEGLKMYRRMGYQVRTRISVWASR
jgi:GNAT superfamily N-acetyltransferase